MGGSSHKCECSHGEKVKSVQEYYKLYGLTENEANDFLTQNVIMRPNSRQRFKYVKVMKIDDIDQELDNNQLIVWERVEVFIQNNIISGFNYDRNE